MDNFDTLDGSSGINTETEGAEENDLDPDEGNQRVCGVCTLPIFSTPCHTSYDEDHDNPSFRHNCCCSQQQLPQVLTQHPLHPRGPLRLHLHKEKNDGIVCNNCREECKGFFYQCPKGLCRFTVDVKCCTTVKVVHRSHRHELTFIPRRGNSLTCGACGVQHQGFFYACDFCGFYLHRDCALLPNMILHREHEDMRHPLALLFTLPVNSLKFQRWDTCSICKEKISSIQAGVYYCLICDDVAIHVKCAAISSESPIIDTVSNRDIATRLPHFPMKDEYTSLMPYLLERQSNGGTTKEERKFFNDKIHDHEMVLCEEYCDEFSQLSHLCDSCLEPVSPPFYTCPQCIGYYLHRCCANLSMSLQPLSHFIDCKAHGKDKPAMQLVSRLSGIDFYSGRDCNGCHRNNNGFFYECQVCFRQLCVRCAILPNAITYVLHGKSHILFLSYTYHGGYSICASCGWFIETLFYECSSCPNFKIDVACALLPTSVSHKQDRHPLELTPLEDSAHKENNDTNFCEICEQSMYSDEWFYGCRECVTQFHISCIPSIGRFRKIKTGRTIRVRCHGCPLTSIQMFTNYSYTCGLCQCTISGKRHGIAFECRKCSFWLHDRCAEKEQLNV